MTDLATHGLESMRFEFFAWAAARAAQAGSSKTTVAVLRGALEAAGAANWYRTIVADTVQAYDVWHLGVVEAVHSKLILVPSMSWGITAKLVNVYIKGRWLLDSNRSGPMQAFGHPAIDSILLGVIDNTYKSTYSGSLRWQRMTRAEYEEVIAFLRRHHQHAAIWTIEEGWSAVR